MRTAVLISGRGSNMTALLHAAADPAFPARIIRVLSNRPDAPGLGVAGSFGVPCSVVDHRAFAGDRAAHEAAIIAQLAADGVELVCLAGYMRLLTPLLVAHFADRMLNIHPSLLPAFPGLHTHERALAAGVKLHGCTVHLVTDDMDQGPILAQAAVPVFEDDTPERLATRVLAQEHAIYPAALAQRARRLADRGAAADACLRNPLAPRPLPPETALT